ncbi:MAG: hypothetical protein IPI04_06330 [Ignavibacteria bacterium]|nr:hypothetical protein [Ignavibacteria bacterium]
MEKILLVARKFGLKPRIPEPVENLLDEIKRKEWYEKKNALVYTFVSDNSPLQLDIFLQYPMSFEELTENSKLIIIDNVSMNVSSPEDLLFVKKLINPLRDKDITDIKALEEIIGKRKKI